MQIITWGGGGGEKILFFWQNMLMKGDSRSEVNQIYLRAAFLCVLYTMLKYGLPIHHDSAYVVASPGQVVGDHYSRILAYGHLFGNLRILLGRHSWPEVLKSLVGSKCRPIK